MAKKTRKNRPTAAEPKQPDRRQALKAVLAGGGVIATALSAPKEWTKPIVESVILPAHAQTSPNGQTTTGQTTTPLPTTA